MKRHHALGAIIGLVGLTACATVTQGMNEGLRVESVPPGAMALTNIQSSANDAINGYLGCSPTPCSISISRKADPVISVSLDGHSPIKFKVTSAVATSSTSFPTGTLVAGLPTGSHVIAGQADLLKRIPVGGRVACVVFECRDPIRIAPMHKARLKTSNHHHMRDLRSSPA